jgi:hypothetical protein
LSGFHPEICTCRPEFVKVLDDCLAIRRIHILKLLQEFHLIQDPFSASNSFGMEFVSMTAQVDEVVDHMCDGTALGSLKSSIVEDVGCEGIGKLGNHDVGFMAADDWTRLTRGCAIDFD